MEDKDKKAEIEHSLEDLQNKREKEKELVTLIAKIIVQKVLRDATEKGHTISEVQFRQTELP